MELIETKQGDVLILGLTGHLDTAAAMPLEEQVLQMIEKGERHVLFDCAQLEYVNSSGLKVFLIAAKRLETLGGQIAICSLLPNVQMIFDMIGFSKILTILPSRAEGLEAFQAKGLSV